MGSRMLHLYSHCITPNSFQSSLMTDKKEALKDTGVTQVLLLVWKHERSSILIQTKLDFPPQTNCFLVRGKTMNGWKEISETGMEAREYGKLIYLGFWALPGLLGIHFQTVISEGMWSMKNI